MKVPRRQTANNHAAGDRFSELIRLLSAARAVLIAATGLVTAVIALIELVIRKG